MCVFVYVYVFVCTYIAECLNSNCLGSKWERLCMLPIPMLGWMVRIGRNVFVVCDRYADPVIIMED